KPLLSRQAVQHKLVEMQRQGWVARCYVLGKAHWQAQGEQVIAHAWPAQQNAVEACDHVVDQAVQLHGGTGYMHGTEVERHYRDSRILPIGGGATEVLTDLAARPLGDGG